MPADSPPPAGPRRAWLWRVAGFLLLFAALQGTYTAQRGGALERFVIDTLTVRTAAALIDWGWPAIGVVADGPRLRAPGGGLNVLNGCEGVDIAFLLLAAMAVAPIPWRRRLLGLVAGLPLVFLLNQLRVIALFHAYRHDRDGFDLLHGGVAPLLMVLVVGVFYLVWVERSVTPERPA